MRSVLLRPRRGTRIRLFLVDSFSQANFVGGWGSLAFSVSRTFLGHRTFHSKCLAVNYKLQLGTCEPRTKYNSTALHSILLSPPAKLSAERASLFVYSILTISFPNPPAFTSPSTNPIKVRREVDFEAVFCTNIHRVPVVARRHVFVLARSKYPRRQLQDHLQRPTSAR